MASLANRIGGVLRHPWMLPTALCLVLALLAWWFLPVGSGPQRERVIQEVTLVVPPPPPPEPEEKIMEEEPEVVEPTEEPEVQKDVDTPTEDAVSDERSEPSEAAGLDKPADAGSDSFRLSAGSGGGLFGRGGGGGGDGGWAAFVETHIRRALRLDPRTRSAQGFVNVVLSIDPSGRISGATLRSSTGDPQLDAAIRDVLSGLPPLGRGRPAAIGGLTYTTINMRRISG